MISVAKSAVPEYLREGEFYMGLDGSDVEIEIPADCLVPSAAPTDPLNLTQIENILKSLRFWPVERTPNALLEFMIKAEGKNTEIFKKYRRELPHVSAMLTLLVSLRPLDATTCKLDNEQLVQHFLDRVQEFLLKQDSMLYFAELGSIEFVDFALANGCTYAVNNRAFAVTASHKHLDLAVYLLRKGYSRFDSRCILPDATLHLQLLQSIHALQVVGLSVDFDASTASAAATLGFLPSLQYLHQHNCPWSTAAYGGAAGAGHLHCLEYLHANGCPRDASAVNSAAAGGHLHCLQYLHAHGCPRTSTAIFSAIEEDHVECLQFLWERQCQLEPRVFAWKHFDPVSFAAEHGRLECLQYLHSQGCVFSDQALRQAAHNGKLSCLKHLVEHGCEVDLKEVARLQYIRVMACCAPDIKACWLYPLEKFDAEHT